MLTTYGGGVAGKAGAPPVVTGILAGTCFMSFGSGASALSSSLVPSWIASLPTTISYDTAALAAAAQDFNFGPYLNTPNVTVQSLDSASTEANPIARALPSWLSLPAVNPPVLRAAQGTAGGTSISNYKFGIVQAQQQIQGFTTAAGRIYDGQGNLVPVRGISLFGFAGLGWPELLYQGMTWRGQLDHMKAMGFTAVRCVVSPYTVHSTNLCPVIQDGTTSSIGSNSDLPGKTAIQILDMWMAYCDSIGLYVMLDMHSVWKNGMSHLWYSAASPNTWNGLAYTAQDWINDCVFLAARYASNPHFFAFDVFNEPDTRARWDSGDPAMTNPLNYWRPNVENCGQAILAAAPSVIIGVQGMASTNFDPASPEVSVPINFGEDLQQASPSKKPLNVAKIPANKTMFLPHTYGPEVFIKSSFNAGNFPANLAADWETNFGYLYPTYCVIPGEWGGMYGATDPWWASQPANAGGLDSRSKPWMDAFVAYMQSKGMKDSWYWAYPYNSTDVGGILDSSINVRQDKWGILQTHWAYATYNTTLFRVENPMREQGMWLEGLTDGTAWGNIRTTANLAFAAVAQAVDSIAVMKTSFANDQFVEGTVSRAAGYNPGVVHQLELLIRFNITANNASGVCVRWAHNGTGSLVRFNGAVGNTTPITLSATAWGAPVDGDKLRAEAIGTALTIKKNGTVIATATI